MLFRRENPYLCKNRMKMKLLDKYTTPKLLLISIISAIVIIYPNIACLPWELGYIKDAELTNYYLYFGFRYVYFCVLIFALMKVNFQRFSTQLFSRRFLYTAIISVIAYGIFAATTLLAYPKASHRGSVLLFQFFAVCFLCALMGHIYLMYKVQRKKEQEIEQLKMENLQSRYNALMSQINPHFFFNSLNGLTSLIRKKNDENTLTYVSKMSDVFRYILQSDKKGLVTIEEELAFVQAFRYMMEIRFANKLQFDVTCDLQSFKLPVLSILPLMENVVAHNTIDSEHKMVVTIRMNGQNELIVINPKHPKLSPPETNGTGLANLNTRFLLLMNKPIRIEDSETMFCVYLPLVPYRSPQESKNI